jgi:hypothetical protein
MTIRALATDDRAFEARVAGPAVLFVAKLHKLGEQQCRRHVNTDPGVARGF